MGLTKANKTSFKKGHVPWVKGRHLSSETKAKMSKAKKGKPTGRSPPMKGKHHTEETKKKMSEAHKGMKYKKRSVDSWNKGLKWDDAVKEKISKSRIGKCTGANNPNWKGGISIIPYFGLTRYGYETLTKIVRNRDSYICQYCGNVSSYDVHHIIPQRLGIDNSLDNLITLCSKCHPKVEHQTKLCIDNGIDPIEIFYRKWSDKK